MIWDSFFLMVVVVENISSGALGMFFVVFPRHLPYWWSPGKKLLKTPRGCQQSEARWSWTPKAGGMASLFFSVSSWDSSWLFGCGLRNSCVYHIFLYAVKYCTVYSFHEKDHRDMDIFVRVSWSLACWNCVFRLPLYLQRPHWDCMLSQFSG